MQNNDFNTGENYYPKDFDVNTQSVPNFQQNSQNNQPYQQNQQSSSNFSPFSNMFSGQNPMYSLLFSQLFSSMLKDNPLASLMSCKNFDQNQLSQMMTSLLKNNKQSGKKTEEKIVDIDDEIDEK